jgi:hypothetical protein
MGAICRGRANADRAYAIERRYVSRFRAAHDRCGAGAGTRRPIVSEYLYSPAADNGGTVGYGATRAWAQISLPGTGWNLIRQRHRWESRFGPGGGGARPVPSNSRLRNLGRDGGRLPRDGSRPQSKTEN